jgi:hypothetical protein
MQTQETNTNLDENSQEINDEDEEYQETQETQQIPNNDDEPEL